MRRAVFPGSFDPLTLGHTNLVSRGLSLFDEIIVAIGQNSAKKYMLPLEKRKQILEAVWKDEPKVKVAIYEGLTSVFCHEQGADFIIRGLRNSPDFSYEKNIAQLNKTQKQGVDTVFLIAEPQLAHINSSIVREIIAHNGDVSPFLPKEVLALL